MQHLSCSVLENRSIADGCQLLRFRLPQGHQSPRPGQFLTLRVGSGISPLLRRPFAYSGYDQAEGTAEIIYERRGGATRLLSAYQAGEALDLIGPLGNTFPPPGAGRHPVLVAGGIGIGPMLFLYRSLLRDGLSPSLLVGARSASRLPMACLPEDALVCTDDGSLGFHGTVIGRLEAGIGPERNNLSLHSCGPHGMMRALAAWADPGDGRDAVPAWVSLEQTMACAVGACMGCVVKTHHEKQYSRVCADGPVYSAATVDWNA
jgi:dihydroorotate dehydrogenase electron transfer subunit